MYHHCLPLYFWTRAVLSCTCLHVTTAVVRRTHQSNCHYAIKAARLAIKLICLLSPAIFEIKTLKESAIFAPAVAYFLSILQRIFSLRVQQVSPCCNAYFPHACNTRPLLSDIAMLLPPLDERCSLNGVLHHDSQLLHRKQLSIEDPASQAREGPAHPTPPWSPTYSPYPP